MLPARSCRSSIFSQAKVGGVWFGFGDVASTHVVEVKNKGRIFAPGAGCGDFGDFVAFPEAVGVAEGLKPGFCADPGAGENDDAFFLATHSAK